MLNSCVVEIKCRSAELMYIAAINLMRLRRHDTRQQSFTPSLSLFASFLDYKFVYCKWWTTEAWQQGYGFIFFLAWYSILHHWTVLDATQTKLQCRSIRYFLAANFASGVGSCMGIVDHSSTSPIQAPPPYNHPPSIFGGWAASAYGVLARDLRVLWVWAWGPACKIKSDCT